MVVVVGNNHDSERRVIMSRLSNTGGVMDIDLGHRRAGISSVAWREMWQSWAAGGKAATKVLDLGLFAMAKIRRIGHDHQPPFLVLGRIKRDTKTVSVGPSVGRSMAFIVFH